MSPTKIIDLDPARHQTGDTWHVLVLGIAMGQLDGYRIEGSYPGSLNKSVLELSPLLRQSAIRVHHTGVTIEGVNFLND